MVTGLKGAGLVLTNGADEKVSIGADGRFSFATPLPAGSSYAVSVATQPAAPKQICTVSNASGTVGNSDIDDVAVLCSVESFVVGGTVTGLGGSGLVLQNNAADDLRVEADGSFRFAVPVASDASYAVTVKTQPTFISQICTVANGNGMASAAASSAVTVNCVLAPPSPQPVRFAYVANEGSNDVSTFNVDTATGALGSMVSSPMNGGGGPFGVAVHPNAKFAYVVNSTGRTVSSFLIQSDGSLVPTTVPTVATGSAPNAIVIDPKGRFAYVVNTAGSVATYVIDAVQGTLTLASTALTGNSPFDLSVHPTGRFVYVVNKGSASVSAYMVDADSGALTQTGGTPATGGAPNHIAVDPTGRFAYVANTNSNNVSVFSIDGATGALTPASTVGAGSGPSYVGIHPSGKYAYVANALADSVSAYTIDASTGSLVPMAVPTVASGDVPSSLTVDPTGRFAYATNLGGNNLSASTIDAITGALSAMSPATVAVGSRPQSVTWSR